MKSDYASVTDQAGIYAGTGGFAIQSKGNTTLEGAVIGSKATADKNSLVTDSLTIKDIKNKAEYTSRNTGLSYTSVSGFKNLSQAGKDAVYNSLGLLPKLLPDSSKSSESTTKSAIANGTIKTQSSNIDIEKISRDTESSLNKLDMIFDKKKVEERQELARLFAKDAFEQLHYWQPKTKEEKIAKALAHAVVAESSARIAGNPAGSGFYAGLSNEALIGEIQRISKTNPAVAQWLSATLGAVVNGALDKPVVTGATEAQYGTKYNASGRWTYDYGKASLDAFIDVINGNLSNEEKEQLYLSATVSYIDFLAMLSTLSIGLGISISADANGQALIFLGDVAVTGYVLYRTVLSGWDATNKLFDFKNYNPLINYNDIMENPRDHMD